MQPQPLPSHVTVLIFSSSLHEQCRSLIKQLPDLKAQFHDVIWDELDLDADAPGMMTCNVNEAAAHGIGSLPTLIVCRGPWEIKRFTGSECAVRVGAYLATLPGVVRRE